MKLKYILAAGALSIATAAQAQEWTADTIVTGLGYTKDGFYDLNTTQTGTQPNNNWDIAFMTGDVITASVMVNHAGNDKNAKLYVLDVDAETSFGTDLTADTAGKTGADFELQNSNTDWYIGAFNRNATGGFSYGWGDYDMSTHYINGNKIYALINGSGAYQIWIEQYKASFTDTVRAWKFHVAKLDGSDPSDVTFKPAADYSNKLFAYYDLTTRTFVNREPDMNNWHLLATKYLDAYDGPGASGVMMSTTGIVTNTNVEVARVSPLMPEDANYLDYSDSYDSVKNVIGGKYKYVDYEGTPPGWVLEDSLSYFIKITEGTGTGDIWQVYFDHFPASTSASTGVDVKIGLQKRRVYEQPSDVKEVNAIAGAVVLAPNPAMSGSTNLLIDAKQNIGNAQITVSDLSGRVISKYAKDINAGFQQLNMNISNYPAGMYIINITAEGWSNTQKLIVR